MLKILIPIGWLLQGVAIPFLVLGSWITIVGAALHGLGSACKIVGHTKCS